MLEKMWFQFYSVRYNNVVSDVSKSNYLFIIIQMISKKINKSAELIFVGPNYLKLSDSKPLIKKSLHLASPKNSTKPTIRTIFKPLTTTKKQRTTKEAAVRESRELKASFNTPSPLPTTSKIKYCSGSKRSKSKLTFHDPIQSDLWRSEIYDTLNSKQHSRHSNTHRRPQSIQLKYSPNQCKKPDKYQRMLQKTQKILNRYCYQIRSLKQEVAFLKEQNSTLKKKLNHR